MTDNNGGPAFPTEHKTLEGTWKYHGMTLRDYFAGRAMQAYITANPDAAASAIAKLSFATADAMIAECDK